MYVNQHGCPGLIVLLVHQVLMPERRRITIRRQSGGGPVAPSPVAARARLPETGSGMSPDGQAVASGSICRLRRFVQGRLLPSVRWGDIPQLSTRDRRRPAAWQQSRPNGTDPRPSANGRTYPKLRRIVRMRGAVNDRRCCRAARPHTDRLPQRPVSGVRDDRHDREIHAGDRYCPVGGQRRLEKPQAGPSGSEDVSPWITDGHLWEGAHSDPPRDLCPRAAGPFAPVSGPLPAAIVIGKGRS